MAYIVRFTDPDDDTSVRLDISNYIAAGSDELDLGFPRRRTPTVESGVRDGVAVGQTVFGARTLRVPLVLSHDSKDELVDLYRDVVREVERGSALEVRLDGRASSVWFDLIPGDIEPFWSSAWWDKDHLRCTLQVEAQPFARGAEVTVVNAVGVDNSPGIVDVAAIDVEGDADAPATVEFLLNNASAQERAANRLIARVYRRTAADPTEFDFLYHPGEVASLGANTLEDTDTGVGAILEWTPVDQTWDLVATWTISDPAETANRAGLFHVFVSVKDVAAIADRLKLRMDLRFASASEEVTGRAIKVAGHASHINAQNYELWHLGTFRIPSIPEPPTSWTWRLYAKRAVGVAVARFNYVMVAPVDESVGVLDWTADADVTAVANGKFTMDAERGVAWWGGFGNVRVPASLIGRGLMLKPQTLNRLCFQTSADFHAAIHDPPQIGNPDGLVSVSVRYRPRFLLVR